MFGGVVRKYKHASDSCGCDMTFSVFLPPKQSSPAPVLLWLSGLTCTDDNFIQKAGAQRAAAARGVALVAPDTSPRGLGVPGEEDGWDLGTGAGFYVDATREPWVKAEGGKSKGYKMFSYVTVDLVEALKSIQEIDTSRISVCGHSMGGHGALVLALRHPETFRSVSAFAPICNPTRVPWGKKAFSAYLGGSGEESIPDSWKRYDACELVKSYDGEREFDVLVDVGTSDEFLDEQLNPESLEVAASSSDKVSVTINRREGYDHSYFFIATFVDDHVEHAARALFS